MRVVLRGLVVLLAGAWAALAADGPTPPAATESAGRPRARRDIAERIINELGLNTTQVNQVRDLDTQRREWVRQAGQDQAKRRQAVLRFQTEVRKVLTEDQAKKFDAMMRGSVTEGLVDRLKKDLALTADQEQKIQALAPQFQRKTEEAGRDVTRHHEAWVWYEQAIRALLTPEQQKKFDLIANLTRTRVEMMGGIVWQDWALRGMALTPDQTRQIDELRAARDRKVEEAVKAFQTGLKGALTPEQMERFEQRMKQGPEAKPMSPPRGGREPGPRRSGKPGTGADAT